MNSMVRIEVISLHKSAETKGYWETRPLIITLCN